MIPTTAQVTVTDIPVWDILINSLRKAKGARNPSSPGPDFILKIVAPYYTGISFTEIPCAATGIVVTNNRVIVVGEITSKREFEGKTITHFSMNVATYELGGYGDRLIGLYTEDPCQNP